MLFSRDVRGMGMISLGLGKNEWEFWRFKAVMILF